MIEAREGVAPYRAEACKHEQQAVRKFTASNGTTHFRKQCLECGANAGSVGKREMWGVPGPVEDWDESLRLSYWERQQEQRRAYYESARQDESEQWWRWYNAYLESPQWQEKRARVLERDGHLCRAAYSACGSRRASQAHHLTYKHVGDEPLFDLIAVCAACHEHITELDRIRNGGPDGRDTSEA